MATDINSEAPMGAIEECIYHRDGVGKGLMFVRGWVDVSGHLLFVDATGANPVLPDLHFYSRVDICALRGHAGEELRGGYGFYTLYEVADSTPQGTQLISAIGEEQPRIIAAKIGDHCERWEEFVRAIGASLESVNDRDAGLSVLFPTLHIYHNKLCKLHVGNAVCAENIGPRAKTPRLSIIVYVEDNIRAIETMLLAFSEEENINKDAEVIFVSRTAAKNHEALEKAKMASAICGLSFNWFNSMLSPSPGHAINQAIRLARGDVLLITHSGMIPELSGWLARTLAIDAMPGIESGVGCRILSAHGHSKGFLSDRQQLVGYGRKRDARLQPEAGALPHWLVLPRERYLAIGGLKEDFLSFSAVMKEFASRLRRGAPLPLIEDIAMVEITHDSCNRSELYDQLCMEKFAADSSRISPPTTYFPKDSGYKQIIYEDNSNE